MSIDEFLERLITRKISKENVILQLSICEYSYCGDFDGLTLPELLINKKRREKYFKRIKDLHGIDAEEIIKVKTNLIKKFAMIQTELKKILNLIPELNIDEDGLIHTKLYKSSCKFKDEDVKYSLNLLNELRSEHDDISASYRRVKEKIMSSYHLNMEEDENEIIVRVVEEIINEKERKRK